MITINCWIMKKIAVFPGSFDPFTIGHEDIVTRALPLFDEIVIAVGINALKKSFFSLVDRKDMIAKAFKGNPKIRVDHFEGLTVDFCASVGAGHIIRGLRTAADFEFERAIAQTNRKLLPDIESIFFLTQPDHSMVNSTIIRDIVINGGDASQFVPTTVNLSDYTFEV